MAEYLVPQNHYGFTRATGYNAGVPDTWHSDNDPATFAELPPRGGYQFGMLENPDLTAAKMSVVGWRLEVDVLSGSGSLGWDLNFDALATGGGYFAFYSGDSGGSTAFTIAGAGTYTMELPHYPSYVGTVLPYEGLHTIVENLAYPPYNADPDYADRNYGDLDWPLTNTGNIQIAEFRIIFYTATAFGIPALRQKQRGDGLGMSGAPRAIQHGSVQASLRQIGFQ